MSLISIDEVANRKFTRTTHPFRLFFRDYYRSTLKRNVVAPDKTFKLSLSMLKYGVAVQTC